MTILIVMPHEDLQEGLSAFLKNMRFKFKEAQDLTSGQNRECFLLASQYIEERFDIALQCLTSNHYGDALSAINSSIAATFQYIEEHTDSSHPDVKAAYRHIQKGYEQECYKLWPIMHRAVLNYTSPLQHFTAVSASTPSIRVKSDLPDPKKVSEISQRLWSGRIPPPYKA